MDQIHEQENVKVKHAGCVFDTLEKGNALLRRWMLAGPEQANILEDFENLFENNMINLRDVYHDEGQASKMCFRQYVGLLARGWEDIGNPFEEECPHLLNIYDRTVVSEEISTCIFNLHEFGKTQYKTFVSDVPISKRGLFGIQLFDYKPATSSKSTSAVKILKKNNRTFF